MKIIVHPLTPERWEDFARLFGPRGACAGCWCQWWRLAPTAWRAGKQGGNREAMRRLVDSGVVPGLLAYDGTEPVGWLAVAPRADYPKLANSRLLAPVDGQTVWSVTCFFVARSHRGQGITGQLLTAAAQHARKAGARWLEGYPVDPGSKQADAFVFTGLHSAFTKAGFVEVTRRSPTRPLMRRKL